MPSSPLGVVIQYLLADRGPDGGGLTDGELLERFLTRRRSVPQPRTGGVAGPQERGDQRVRWASRAAS